MLLLLLDVGNTRLKWGLWQAAADRPGQPWLAHGAMALQDIETLAAELRHHPQPRAVLGCAVAGTIATARVEAQLQQLGLRPSWLHSPPEQCGVRNGYTIPGLLGPDRWAALVGARQRCPQQPALVISVGTAVTIDGLAADGRFLGGVILPGFGLMLKALEMGTAGLKVPEGDLREFPANTSDALMTGGALAISGAAQQMAGRMTRYAGEPVQLLLTGGAAPKLAPELGLSHILVENLVFEGLLCIARERGLA